MVLHPSFGGAGLLGLAPLFHHGVVADMLLAKRKYRREPILSNSYWKLLGANIYMYMLILLRIGSIDVNYNNS